MDNIIPNHKLLRTELDTKKRQTPFSEKKLSMCKKKYLKLELNRYQGQADISYWCLPLLNIGLEQLPQTVYF